MLYARITLRRKTAVNVYLIYPSFFLAHTQLWEMACARNIGLSNLPIVVINVDGYYEPFRQMIERAYADELIKMKPENLVHFVPSAEEAVVWIEQQQGTKKDTLAGLQPKLQKRASVLKRSSFMNNPSVINWFRSRSDSMIVDESNDSKYYHLISLTVPFIAGVILGMTLTTKRF
jgi:Possible lysine decarboxylase